MDIKKQIEIGYYDDILKCIQDKINDISKQMYSSDECPPQFTVSNLWINEDTQKIILTCNHCQQSFSRVLFPIKENYWGYDSLGNMIKDLYNQTM